MRQRLLYYLSNGGAIKSPCKWPMPHFILIYGILIEFVSANWKILLVNVCIAVTSWAAFNEIADPEEEEEEAGHVLDSAQGSEVTCPPSPLPPPLMAAGIDELLVGLMRRIVSSSGRSLMPQTERCAAATGPGRDDGSADNHREEEAVRSGESGRESSAHFQSSLCNISRSNQHLTGKTSRYIQTEPLKQRGPFMIGTSWYLHT